MKYSLSFTNSSVFAILCLCIFANAPRPAVFRHPALQPRLANGHTLINPDTSLGAKYKMAVKYPNATPLLVFAFSVVIRFLSFRPSVKRDDPLMRTAFAILIILQSFPFNPVVILFETL